MQQRVLMLTSASIQISMAPVIPMLTASILMAVLSVSAVQASFRAGMVVSKLMNVKERSLELLQGSSRNAKLAFAQQPKPVFIATFQVMEAMTTAPPCFVPVMIATIAR